MNKKHVVDEGGPSHFRRGQSLDIIPSAKPHWLNATGIRFRTELTTLLTSLQVAKRNPSFLPAIVHLSSKEHQVTSNVFVKVGGDKGLPSMAVAVRGRYTGSTGRSSACYKPTIINQYSKRKAIRSPECGARTW